jgi:hypothetical protein
MDFNSRNRAYRYWHSRWPLSANACGAVRGPEKIRVCAIAGAMLVVIGTALEIVSVWPTQDVDASRRLPIS